VSVVVDEDGELMADPRISAPGSMDEIADKALIEACEDEVADAVERLKRGMSEAKIKEAARLALRKMLKTELAKKPLIDVQVIRV
jgi:ribonuclease J